MKTVVIGISSGIAAYKMKDVVRLLRKKGVNVTVVMTASATKMVSVEEFEKASGNKVYVELFEEGFDYKKVIASRTVDHISRADAADLIIIAPATANTIAKIAHGIADNFLTTMLLAATCPVVVCPSMNVHMWHHPATQKNLRTMSSFGYHILGPDKGPLACGYDGEGRLVDTHTIVDTVLDVLSRRDSLKGKRILVTAGGTVEAIDAVRSITNRSSGKMGIGLAEACYRRGASVTLLVSKTAVSRNIILPEESFTTSEELRTLVQKQSINTDIIFHCAAMSDFTVANPVEGKISSGSSVTVSLQPLPKLLDSIKTWNPHVTLIAFKAAYAPSRTKLMSAAQKKLSESTADAVVANDISSSDRGFESDTNEVIVVLKNGESLVVSLAPKKIVAETIIDFLIEKRVLS